MRAVSSNYCPSWLVRWKWEQPRDGTIRDRLRNRKPAHPDAFLRFMTVILVVRCYVCTQG